MLQAPARGPRFVSPCPLRQSDVPRLIYSEKRPGTGTPARTGTPASPGAPTGAGIPAGTGLIRRRPLASVPSSNSRGFVLPGTGSPAAPPAPSPGTGTAAGTGTGTAAPGPWPEPAATSAARPKFGGLRICPGVPRSEGRTGCAGPGLGGAPRGAGAAGASAGLGGGMAAPCPARGSCGTLAMAPLSHRVGSRRAAGADAALPGGSRRRGRDPAAGRGCGAAPGGDPAPAAPIASSSAAPLLLPIISDRCPLSLPPITPCIPLPPAPPRPALCPTPLWFWGAVGLRAWNTPRWSSGSCCSPKGSP